MISTSKNRQSVGAALCCALAAQALRAEGAESAQAPAPSLAPAHALSPAPASPRVIAPAWAPTPTPVPVPPMPSAPGVALNSATNLTIPYQGGRIIARPQVSNIFWNGDVLAQEHLNSFVRYTVKSVFVSGLAEYGLQGDAMGSGALLDISVLAHPSGQINCTTQDVVNTLSQLTMHGTIAPPGDNRMALVYLPPAATFTDTETGHLSCNTQMLCTSVANCFYFCGTHGVAQLPSGSLPYGVIVTDPTCVGCFSGTETTNTVAAVLADTMTNPDKKSWSTEAGETITSLCDSSTWKDGYRFADLWSNCQSQCVPVGSTTFTNGSCTTTLSKGSSHIALYIGLGAGIGAGIAFLLTLIGLRKLPCGQS